MPDITNNTEDNKCSRCGDCCGIFIPVTDQEVKEIQEYVKKHNIKQVTFDERVENGTFKAMCCFFDQKEKKCRIYDARPYVCRNFLCSNKDWKERRTMYESRAKYNSTINKTIMASFDDLIYYDYEPLLFMIKSMFCKDGKMEVEQFVEILLDIGRKDLLDMITMETDTGEKIKGSDISDRKTKPKRCL